MTSAHRCAGCAGIGHLTALIDVPRSGSLSLASHRPSRRSEGRTPRHHRRAPADLILRGRILTMDATNPVAEAVAVRDARIVAMGALADIASLRSSTTEVRDFSGQVVMPGFVEPHMHYWGPAMFFRWVDCSVAVGPSRPGAKTFDDIVAKLKNAPPTQGDWTLGCQFDPSLLPDGAELTRDVLDDVGQGRPVAVLNASMHYLYVNSAALALAGITDDTPDPPGGFLGRENGRLTGAFGEPGAMALMFGVLPVLDEAGLRDNVVAIARRARAAGITSTHEAATGTLFGTAEARLLGDTIESMGTRTSYAIFDSAADAFVDSGLTPFAGTDLLRATSWKLIADGSNQGRSGYQVDPYLGGDERGHANFDRDYAAQRIRRAHDLGWQLMIHANGDAAAEMVVGAYEDALAAGEAAALRHRMEHCSFATTDHLRRMAALGVSPSFLIGHVAYWGRTLAERVVGWDKAQRLDPVRTAYDLGLIPSFHSDYRVTDFEPLRMVATAVTRRMADGGDVLGPDQRVSVAEAVAAVTTGAAWQIHAENDVGSLAVGHFADFAVVDADPFAVPADEIADIGVVTTFLGGDEG